MSKPIFTVKFSIDAPSSQAVQHVIKFGGRENNQSRFPFSGVLWPSVLVRQPEVLALRSVYLNPSRGTCVLQQDT